MDTDPSAGPLEANGAAQSSGNGNAAGSEADRANPVSSTAGAKIGEVSADGRIATLVGYTSAAGATSRRPRRAASGATLDPVVLPAPVAAAVPVVPGDGAKEPTAAASLSRRAPLAAPPVRKLAKDLGVELTAVTPTRSDGVISRSDVESAAAARVSGSATMPAGTAALGTTDPGQGCPQG